MDHFENIQSTNWQTIRFKPPPPNSSIAWRVEFRSMEVQLTDFENAAFSIFIVLLTRAILSFNLNFYMPISQVRNPPPPKCRCSADLSTTGRREHAARTEAQRSPRTKVLLPQMGVPVGKNAFSCGLQKSGNLAERIEIPGDDERKWLERTAYPVHGVFQPR